MDSNLKVSIFNPTDKLSDRPKIYLGCVPPDKKSIVKKNDCIYDVNNYRWFTTNENNKMIQDFSKRNIDFWEFMNECGIKYDNETKKWYTYNSNERLQKHFI